jgi:ribonuclease HI
MTIRIVTDGACRGNPGPGGWAALVIHDGRIEELGGHEPHTTNNRMELRAAIEGLRRVPADAQVHITTDSQYVLRGMTQWLKNWQRRGWKTRNDTPVENQDLWQTLAQLAGKRVQWQHVYGHTGDPENERANTIAQAYAAGKSPGRAPRLDRQAAVSRSNQQATPPPEEAHALLEQIAAARPARTTYLSLVGGTLARHTTWKECQARVHGVPRARYKKCTSAEEEITTVHSWGLPPDTLTR